MRIALVHNRKEVEDVLFLHAAGIRIAAEEGVRRANERVPAPREDEEVRLLRLDAERMAVGDCPREDMDALRKLS